STSQSGKSAAYTDGPSAKKTVSKDEVTKMKVVDLGAELSQPADDDDDDDDYDDDDDVVNDEAEEIATRQREDISVMLENNLNIEETPRARVPSNMPRMPRYEVSRRAMLTFRDVENSIKKFSGDDHLDIKQWLRNIEELAEIYG
ncbi:hypothetical protein PV325_011677, partial [Microctonus aethiopoides]